METVIAERDCSNYTNKSQTFQQNKKTVNKERNSNLPNLMLRHDFLEMKI